MQRPALMCLMGLSLCSCAVSEGQRADAQPQTSPEPPRSFAAQRAHPAPAHASAAAPTSGSARPALAVPAASASSGSTDVRELRVYAKARFVWIREQPSSTGWIGYLWTGGSVKVADPKPKPGSDCLTYYAVEPRGFICVDDRLATLNPDDAALAQIRPHVGKLESAWPHAYGESRGLERYQTLPSVEEQRRREWDLAEHLARVEAARSGTEVHPSLAAVDVRAASKPAFAFNGLPPTVHEQRRSRLNPMSTVAWIDEVDHAGRPFLLTADLMWVPKDRVAVYPHVSFQGVLLGRDARLPLAFFRGQDRPQFVRTPAGELVENGQSFRRLSFVELTGASVDQGEVTYLETKQDGVFVRKADAVVPTPQEKTPWGAPVGMPDTTKLTPPGRATWMEASVLGGWLIAYEGTSPVYATMISPGRGGIPVPGKDPLSTASTPTGSFKITGKFATATMVAPYEFIHSDVPWTQNFSGPHALHGAYWHDDWGNPKSAGCVNVSPVDGRWLYFWTEPDVPTGWHGVRWMPKQGPATTFVVHR